MADETDDQKKAFKALLNEALDEREAAREAARAAKQAEDDAAKPKGLLGILGI